MTDKYPMGFRPKGCPHCGKKTVVDTRYDDQRCDHCEKLFVLDDAMERYNHNPESIPVDEAAIADRYLFVPSMNMVAHAVDVEGVTRSHPIHFDADDPNVVV